MNLETFTFNRNILLEKKKKNEAELNMLYTKLVEEYIDANSPVEKLKVYELIENGNKRRGFKRFVIYSQDVKIFNVTPMISVGGWWLNKENIPEKWDSMTVHGVGNPAVFKLSDDQTAYEHSDSKEE